MLKYKKGLLISLSATTMLSMTTIVPTFASTGKYYDYSNYKIENLVDFCVTLNLSNAEPYGKVHYYNSSDYDAIICVEGQEPKTIAPHSGGSVQWKKGIFKNDYMITINEQDNEHDLNGTFSLAKADRAVAFTKE